MTTTFAHTVTTYGIEIDGVEHVTTFRPEEYIDPKIEVGESKTTITYAHHEGYWGSDSPLEDDEFVQFQEFTSEDARNDFAAEMLEEGWTIFFVNHFEHSSSHYSVITPEALSLGFQCPTCSATVDRHGVDAEGNSFCEVWEDFYGTKHEADHEVEAITIKGDYRAGWDDRPSGVVAISPDLEEPLKAAVSTMETYTSWANGEVYAIVTETYVNGETTSDDYDICGGFIGHEYAQLSVNMGI